MVGRHPGQQRRDRRPLERALTASPDRPRFEPAAVGPYFDALYATIDASATHALIGREALGDAYLGQLGYADEGELLRLAEVAGVGRGRRVLDIACGTGGVSRWYAERTGAAVTGIDCSAVGLRLGARSLPGRGTTAFALADLRALPFAGGTFDALVCLDGFGADFGTLAAEARRLLTPGGGLAVLLSLEAGVADEVVATLAAAGLDGCFAEHRTAEAGAIMERWLGAYRRHASAHIAEVGERYHRALVDEIAGLLDGYASGAVERVLIGARAPE